MRSTLSTTTPTATAQRSAGGVVVGLQRQHELARFQAVPAGHDRAVLGDPLALAHGADHVLGVGTEAWSDGRGDDLQRLLGQRRHVVGQHDLTYVDLVGDDVDEGAQRLGVGGGDGDGREGLAHAAAVGLAHRQGGRAHVAHLVHRAHQRLVVGQVVGTRPVSEVR